MKEKTPEVGVCIVTFKRPKKLIKMLSGIKKNTHYKNYKIYIIIDYEEDWDTLREIERSGMKESLPIEKIEMLSSPAECVKTTSRSYSIGDEPFFVWISDDMEVETDWLQEAMKCMATFPDGEGLVVFQDGIQNGKNACAGLISRNYIKTKLQNIFYDEIYKHFCADTELFKRSKLLGRVKYCPTSIVWHYHPSAKGKHKSKNDEIYKNSLPLWKRDRVIFRQRELKGFQ